MEHRIADMAEERPTRTLTLDPEGVAPSAGTERLLTELRNTLRRSEELIRSSQKHLR